MNRKNMLTIGITTTVLAIWSTEAISAQDKYTVANDAKCGFAGHTIVKTRDFVFTDYGKR